MKTHLPYNVLLAVTIAVTGFVALYNLSLRESYATTLRYSYPVVEQAQPEAPALPEPERIAAEPEGEGEPEAPPQPDAPEEEPGVLRVQFPLDLNTATLEQLRFIPQVGDVMSQRIVQYRDVLGGYTDLEQLKDIKGVGEKTYEHLYTYLIITDETGETEASSGDESEGQEDGREAQDEAPKERDDIVNRQNLYGSYEDYFDDEQPENE